MKGLRIILFLIIVAGGITVSTLMIRSRTQPAVQSSLAPAYTVAGQATKAVDRAVTKALPIDDLDEAAFGDELARRMELDGDDDSVQARYLQKLMAEISVYGKKPFQYRVYAMDSPVPNAFAMPGGVIVVTHGLLYMLETESQLVGILAHEMGHVEHGHCMDAVKFQLLADKAGLPPLGVLADMAQRMLVQHSYSKTQEDEADAYAFKVLLETRYNPSGLGQGFKLLMEKCPTVRPANQAHPIYDYLMTHTPTPIREERYRVKAENWWRDHAGEQRYDGRQNLTEFQAMSTWAYDDEWITEQPGPAPQQEGSDADDFWK